MAGSAIGWKTTSIGGVKSRVFISRAAAQRAGYRSVTAIPVNTPDELLVAMADDSVRPTRETMVARDMQEPSAAYAQPSDMPSISRTGKGGIVSGRDLYPQITTGFTVDPSQLKPVSNGPSTKYTGKPEDGGLWTSTYQDGVGSAWINYDRSEWITGSVNDNWQVITPDPSAKVFVINSAADIQSLTDTYSAPSASGGPVIDFAALARAVDGVSLTAQGMQAAYKLGSPLRQWNVESTLWFRPAFTVTPIATIPAAEDTGY
jgi:hypothetical protein